MFKERILKQLTMVIAVWMIVMAGPVAGQETKGPTLVVIDIQEFYFPDGAMPLVGPIEAVAQASRLIADWRTDGRPVVHVGHTVQAGGSFHQSVLPVEGERVVMKTEVSCFNGTGLGEELKAAGVEQLIICGMQTHMCLEGAVRAAYDLGFDVVVAADACATRDLQFGDTTVAAADVHAATLATLEGGYAEVLDTDQVLERY